MLGAFPKVISVVQEAVVTDLSSTDMLRLGMMFKDATDKDVTTVAFPGIPKYVDGTSFPHTPRAPLALNKRARGGMTD